MLRWAYLPNCCAAAQMYVRRNWQPQLNRLRSGSRWQTYTLSSFYPGPLACKPQAGAIFSTGNADIAFVARSQLPVLDAPFNLDLNGLIAPLPQDAALLNRADDNPAAQAFWDWLTGPDARQIITDAGYGLPGE